MGTLLYPILDYMLLYPIQIAGKASSALYSVCIISTVAYACLYVPGLVSTRGSAAGGPPLYSANLHMIVIMMYDCDYRIYDI